MLSILHLIELSSFWGPLQIPLPPFASMLWIVAPVPGSVRQNRAEYPAEAKAQLRHRLSYTLRLSPVWETAG